MGYNVRNGEIHDNIAPKRKIFGLAVAPALLTRADEVIK